jgi:hypothetical protein
MENFPSNSKNPVGDNQKPPEKVIESVVTTEVVIRKQSFGRRLKGIFLGPHIKGAANYVFKDVLIPAAKNMIVDATARGAERAVYGEAPRRRYDEGRPRIRYDAQPERYDRSSSHRGTLPDQPPLGGVPRRRQSGDIFLVSREEAENVIERLGDIIDVYKVATVADLHSLCNLPRTYIDNKWGWQSITYANVRQVREGFLLDLPPVEPLT